MKIRLLILAGIVLPFGSASASADLTTPERLFPELESILKSAVSQSPRMLNRALDLEIAENDRIAGRSGLLPYVGGFYNQTESRDDRADLADTLSVSKVYYNASLTQPLFHWGERKNNYQASKIREEMSKGNYREAYRLLAQELRYAYLQLIVKKAHLGRARFHLDFQRSQLRLAEERLAKKVISEPEMFTFRLNVERAEIELDRSEYDLLNSKRAFARVSGTRLMEDGDIPETIPTVAYDAGKFDGALAGFLAQSDPPTQEAVNLRGNLKIEELTYRNQKTRLRPKFSFITGITQDEQSYTINFAQKYRVTSHYVGIAINWAVFDGFATGAAVRNSLARRRQMENDYRDLTQRLAEQAQTQVKLLNFSARNMAITDRFVVSAEGLLKARQDDFARGVMSETDVNNAKIGLLEARINALHARVDFLSKTGEFLGTVVEDPILTNLPARP